jgi:hypothetical protein
MIKYFSIKKRIDKAENKRNRSAELYFREKKTRKSKKEKATYISKNKNILISGEVASGKTKELLKLYNYKETLYNNKRVKTNKFIYFNCNISLSEILEIFETTLQTENKTLSIKELQTKLDNIEEDQDEELDPKQRKTLYTRLTTLEEYSKGAIIFIDDINKASGRKLEVLKELIRNSKIWIATTTNSHNINQNLQKNMNLKNKDSYYKFTLNTTQAVDATNVLFIIFIIFLIVVGQTDMAILLMAGRFMLKQGTGK